MTRQIATPRLVLRELEPSDYSAAYEGWLADPTINQFLETRHAVQDQAAIEAFIASVRARDDEFLFGIFLADGGRHIGNIKVGPIRAHHNLADVSILIGASDCWGKGYACEAISALTRYAFDELGLSKLSASMYAPNQGSLNAFLKAGYQREGLRRAHLDLDGERCDLIELGLTPDDL